MNTRDPFVSTGKTGEQACLTVEQSTAIDTALERVKEDPGAVLESEVLTAIRAVRHDPVLFARIRHKVKQARSVPMGEFDKLTSMPGDDDEQISIFPRVEPWPEAVDGAELLNKMENLLARFVVADSETLQAACLWVAFTWFHSDAQVSPLAHISAPEKRCGKSVLLDCLRRLVARPLPVANISSAALYRAIEKWQPCLLIDEVDSFVSDNEDLRGIINSGFNRDLAFVMRCAGEDHEPTPFNVFSPKVLCGIGKLPCTIMDRAIPLRLRRKKAGERTERLRYGDAEEWKILSRQLARWSSDHAGAIYQFRPDDIVGLNDRAQDAWEPLQQVAALAGGGWSDAARHAALALHDIEDDALSAGVELLADIKMVFETKRENRLFSADLLGALNEDEEAPWATWNRGRPMTARQLARRLKDFGISSGTVRNHIKTSKGYKLEQFSDAFTRYLSSNSDSASVTPSHTRKSEACSGTEPVTPLLKVTDEEPLKASNGAGGDVVTDKIPRLEGGSMPGQGAEMF